MTANNARDSLTLRQFAEHVERMERMAVGRTYPIWKRPARHWRLHLIGPDGTCQSHTFGTLKSRREARRYAKDWNSQPLRNGYRVEVHRA